ncbi:uncharacterized protein LOC116163979 [Photinus pyralis]|uniref:uncharacterized protein LOC116163979 n=1 Tax=Photinus pyralis TaxID=7054 RepID=UPI0012677C8D|nr:uncharacterized protein LOC116163979 [Photinus pyralis]
MNFFYVYFISFVVFKFPWRFHHTTFDSIIYNNQNQTSLPIVILTDTSRNHLYLRLAFVVFWFASPKPHRLSAVSHTIHSGHLNWQATLSGKVYNCNSTTKTTQYKFHSFPREAKEKRSWLNAIKSGKQPSKHAKVCEKHFRNDDYVVTSLGQWKILKKSAIPSQNLPRSSHHLEKRDSTARSERYLSRHTQKIVTDNDKHNVNRDNEIVDIIAEDVEEQVEVERSGTHHAQIQTIISLKRSQLISASFIDEAQMKHMTGFSRKLFIFFVNILAIHTQKHIRYLPMKTSS